jgi:F-type H+-transporting ATPase subunit b
MHIDWWTLAFQTVNVLVLIWLLARFFFRPVADIVAKRQAQANKVLAEALAARQQAANARADADKARAEIATERDRLIAEALKSAQLEKTSLLARTSDQIAKQRGAAEAAIARDQSAAKQAIIARASELAVEIAQRLLGRLPPAAALSAFLEGLSRELRAVPSDARASFTSASAAGHAVEVMTAAPLSKDEMEHVCDALKAAFGLELPFAFRTDPALIAGIELRSPNTIVRNSWRADLDRIHKELDRDGHPSGS